AMGKESCISALLEILRPCDHHVVLDDGWQPWDLLLYHGVWLRGQIKVLVANHGAERRRVDVGIELRRTLLAKLLTGAGAIGAMLSMALGNWPAVGLFAGATLATEAVLGHELYRFARAFRDAVTIAFRSLPVVALRSGAAEPAPR